MRINLKYFGVFGKITGRRAEVIELPAGGGLSQLLDELVQRHGPAIRDAAADRAHRSILVDGRRYAGIDDSDMILEEGQEIAFLQVMIGG